MAGELKRADIIEDDALKAPLVLADNFDVLIKKLNELIASVKVFQTNMNGDSITKLKDATAQLSKEEEQLAKIQKQIADTSAKNNDSYRAQEQALQKVRNEVKNNAAASDSWTKEVTKQNSSLQQLEQALNKNRVAYAALSNEQTRNSDSGKKLLSIIQNQARDVDTLRTNLGQAQQRVGGYREAIEAALPGLQKFAPQVTAGAQAVENFGSKLVTLIQSPVTLGIAAVAVGIGLAKTAIDKFFDTTIEGSDKAVELSSVWAANIATVNNAFREIGKSIVNILPDAEKLTAAEAGLLSYLGFAGTGANLLVNQQVAITQAKLLNEIKKEEITITLENTKLQLEKDKELYEARDKVRNSDEERYEALKKARALGKEIRENSILEAKNEIESVRNLIKLTGYKLTADQTALDLLHDKNAQEKVGYDLVQKLAEAEAKIPQIQDARYKGARRIQALEYSIIEDILKRQKEANKTLEDSFYQTGETIYQNQISVNTRIANNFDKSLDDKVKAQQKAGTAEIDLVYLNAQKEITSARETALERVEVDSEVRREIFDNQKLSIKEKASLYQQEKNKLVDIDVVFQEKVKSINEKAKFDEQKLERENGQKIATIIAEDYQYYINLRKRVADRNKAEDLTALNERYKAGAITLKQFELEKYNLEQDYAKQNLATQIDEEKEELKALIAYYQKKGSITKEGEELIVNLRKKIADDEQTQSAFTLALQEQRDKEAAKLRVQIAKQILVDFREIGDQQFALQQSQINDRIQALQDEKDSAVKQAGDNKNAQLQVEKDYNKRIADEQKALKDVQRRQAIYDKALSALSIVENTGSAAIAALAPPPTGLGPVFGATLLPFIFGLGALQEAIVLAQPIPAYAGGVDSAPGGLALINEEGPELIVSPRGRAKLYDTPGAILTHLEPGSEVYTARETQQIMNGGTNFDDSRIVKGLDRVADGLSVDVVAQADELYKVTRSRDGSKKWSRYKNLGYDEPGRSSIYTK